jgi:hypothetical protein
MNSIPKSLQADIKRFGLEQMDSGELFVPRARAIIGGVFGYEHYRGGALLAVERDAHNIITNQGLNHILDVVLHGTTPVSPWYMLVFEGNYTPVAGDTAASFPASATESTAYDEATRVEYNEAAASSQSTTNSANKATFTFNATKTIYGAALVSVSTKGATTGTLLCANKATASKSVVDDDQLLITYTLSVTSA